MEGFNTRVELDTHITDKHIFICGECLKTFKTKEERVMHTRMDHKDVSTKTTEQEKLLAEEYRRRESRKEKDRRATAAWQKVWSEYAAKKEQQPQPTATQTREEAERAEGDDKDEDEDYVPSEEPSSEDPTYEPTKKELRRADKEGDQ